MEQGFSAEYKHYISQHYGVINDKIQFTGDDQANIRSSKTTLLSMLSSRSETSGKCITKSII